MLCQWLILKTQNVVFAHLDNCASVDIVLRSHHNKLFVP